MNEAQVNPAETVVAEPVAAAAETSVTPVVPEPEPTIPKSRFDEVYRHRRDAERERDYWREQAMQAKPKEPEPLVLPTPEQHGFDDAKYQSALVEYNRGIAKATAISAYQAEKARDQQQQKAQSFRQLETEFEAKNPQYREKVYNSGLPISQATAELIADSPDGPAVALYLADNIELAQQIYDLPPVQAARELGRIEARLAQKVTPRPALTNAPPPPPTIDAGEPAISVSPGDAESDKLSISDWMKRRNKQVHKKR